jgi:hypothetical protein
MNISHRDAKTEKKKYIISVYSAFSVSLREYNY